MQQSTGYFQFYDKFERNQLVKAVDISRYQYPLAGNTGVSPIVSTTNGFNAYQDNGNEFIILKAGNQNTADSGYTTDTSFTIENINKFKDSKLKIGTYWYCRHLNVNIQTGTYPGGVTDANIIAEATLEANNYAIVLQSVFGTGNCGDLIPALDFEDNRWTGSIPAYTWLPTQLFLYMKTFKDVMISIFPQLDPANPTNPGKGIMLYTAYYYIDNCSTTNDIRNISGAGIATEIPALWFAANTCDIGALSAGYNGTVATCTATTYSQTINISSVNNYTAVNDEVVIVDVNKNILGNGKITSKPSSTSFIYTGIKVTTDSNCTVVKSTPYPNYNLTQFGGYDKWMIWQYSSDMNRLGKQYSTTTTALDLDVFDNNNFSMNEILSYPYIKPKLVEILEDKADKTHSHVGQYLPTNGGTLDGDTTITSPISFIFKQEEQKSFKLSRNNTDYSTGSYATKIFFTPSNDVWSTKNPSGATDGTYWEPEKAIGFGTDGFLYHNQVGTEGYIKGMLPATTAWYRIAQCPSTVLTSTGTFTFRNNYSNDRTCGKFIASSSYGTAANTNLTQLSYARNASNGITQARLVYQDSVNCYLEVYHNNAVASTLEIILSDNLNWTWTAFNTGTNVFATGSVPGSYTAKTLTFDNGINSMANISTDGQLKSTIAIGTAPLVVTSTTKVDNLNVDRLDDLEATDFVKKDGSVTMTGLLTLSANPSAALGAATKQYVDGIAAGFKTKDSCLVATTGNITLADAQTIDGVAVVNPNRVLVWQQSSAQYNGIYVVTDSGAWTRATDFDDNIEIAAGAYTFVTSGSTYANNGFTVTTTGTITPDTTPFNFTLSTGAGTITAGTGLTKVGNTFNIDVTGVGAGTYQSVTVNTQGQVTAGTTPTTLAGYGIVDAANIVHDHATSITGSAAKLTTARTITVSGDVSGSASFDGSANIDIVSTMTGGNVYANVKSFGAVGNGSTDDSTAIQSALTSLSATGGTIIFPQGTYAIATALTIYANTTITGIGNVILKRTGAIDNMMINYSNGTTGGYDANSNITIDNIKFNANDTVSGSYDCKSLAFGHMIGLVIKNCEFYNNDGGNCIVVNAVKDAVIDNCYFHNFGDPTSDTTKAYVTEMINIGGMIDASSFSWFGPYAPSDNTFCDNVTISNCKFIGDSGTDVCYLTDNTTLYYRAIGNHAYLTSYYSKNIAIRNNKFANISCGVRLDDIYTLQIEGNRFNNVYMGILFEPHNNATSNVVITNNKFLGVYSATPATYLDCRFVSINPAGANTKSSTRFVVSNNVVSSCHYHGIAGTVDNIVVSNNAIDTCGKAGILLYGGNRWGVNDNVVTSCNTHSSLYGEITLGGNAGTALSNSIVSNNTLAKLAILSGASTVYATGNICSTSIDTTYGTAISKANVIAGTYTA